MFKKGDTVKCISVTYGNILGYGKIYKVLKASDSFKTITVEKGELELWWDMDRFELVEKFIKKEKEKLYV